MSVTKEQIKWAMESMKDWYDGVNKLNILKAAYRESIEALIELTSNHMYDIVTKTRYEAMQKAIKIIDKYPGGK